MWPSKKKTGMIEKSKEMLTQTTEFASNMNEFLNDDVKKTLGKSDELISNANNLVHKIRTFVEKLENYLPLIIILLSILALSGLGTMIGVFCLVTK